MKRNEPKKKQYKKPEIKKVVLKPEEAVLGGCKVNGQSGPGYANCNLASVYCNTNVS